MIILTKKLEDQLLAHAAREYPKEACGVLAGTIKESARKVTVVFECANVDTNPDIGYEIDPLELIKVMTGAETKGLEIIGFYHSHPMALGEPSMVDEYRATWPGHTYMIVSPKSKQVITSWIWDDEDGFVEEDVEVN